MKKYYYHVTAKYWGKEVTLRPKKRGFRRDFHEPIIARTCVCPTIEGCLSAIYLYEMEEWNVYRTKNKIIAHNCKNIPDSKITQEKWIKTPVKFVYIGSVRGKEFEKVIEQSCNFYCKNDLLIGDGKEKTLKYQKKFKIKLQNLIKDKKILIKKITKKEMVPPLKFVSKRKLKEWMRGKEIILFEDLGEDEKRNFMRKLNLN